jgi:tetratricopeptide (TPR) repeat protein
MGCPTREAIDAPAQAEHSRVCPADRQVSDRLNGKDNGDVVFVADDLAAWLIGLLADRGRRRMTTILLGTEQERALRSAASAAIHQTARDLCPVDDKQAEQVALVISHVFGEPVPDAPLARHTTVLEAMQAGISGQLAVLKDADLTGTGQSPAEVLGVAVSALAEKLAGHLVREILMRGARGGPLFPLASQLNDDATHLQGQQIQGALSRLRSEIMEALAQLDEAHAARGRAVQAAMTTGMPRVVNVPRTEHTFVGRADELELLTDALITLDERAPGGVVVQAMHGLGGVGKSTLAAYWARAHAVDYEVVWWITADTPPSLDAGLADLAVALEPDCGGQPLKTLTARAIAWLAAHRRWLLVLDNVTDQASIAPLLDRASTGRAVVTSRLAEGWHRLGATVIRLGVLTEEQATELLTSIATQDRNDADLTGSADLATELGCLPLAIEQAAAYIHQTHLSPAAYLALLQENPAVMYDQTARGADAERSIARIWRVTLDALGETALAGHLLRTMAWWASESIPRFLLEPVADPVDVTNSLSSLAAFNMITLNTDTVTVHRLVQAVARTPDANDPHRQHTAIDAAHDQATHLLIQACPADPLDPAMWPTWRSLLTHVDALASRGDSDDTVFLLDRSATFLQNQGALARAVAYFERALASGQRLHGDDHPLTMDVRNNLALAYRDIGDLERAVDLTEHTLADRERVLGPDHPETLTTRGNLASIYRDAGDLKRAIELNKRTAADCERVLGRDHPDTLRVRSNLAVAYGEAGDLEQAIPLSEQTLADRERVLGPDHPDTLVSRNTLALAYQEAGDLERAIELTERTLADRERVLGPDHPRTLTSRHNLALAYGKAGNLEQEIRLYEQTLADRERVLGPDNPETWNTRSSLAVAYSEAGDLERGIPLSEQSLAQRERVLGPDHPRTLLARYNLARAYQQAGNMDRAIPLYEQTLADCERVLGAEHSLTMTVRRNLRATGR